MSYPPPPPPPPPHPSMTPPPYPPGPPMYLPPPPPQKQRSLGSAMFSTLMVTLLGISITLNIWLLLFGGIWSLAGSGGSAGGTSDVVMQGDPTRKIYLVELSGLIQDTSTKRMAKLFKQISQDPAAKAVILHVDSPGGTVSASEDIYQLVRSLKGVKQIPVVIEQGGLATSGGYYVSAAGDRIFASRTTWTGNIGVIAQRFNVSKLMEKYGVDDATLVSTGAIYKDAGSMFKPENARDRAYLQGLLDQAFDTFKDVVSEGRAKRLTKPIDEIANGAVYTADEAMKLGLIDGTGGRDEAVKWLQDNYGLKGAEIVRLDDFPTLASLFGASGKLTAPPAAVFDTPVAKVELTEELIHTLLTPRPMYLWRGN